MFDRFNFLIATYSIIVLQLHLSSVRGAKLHKATEMLSFYCLSVG